MFPRRARSPRPLSWALFLLLGPLLLAGCAGDYVARTRGVRQAYEREDYPRALEDLSSLEREGSPKDTLLILLDRGMVLHAAGRWEESIRVLAEADRLSAELDAISVTEEAGALLSSERQRAYRGEDFEKLMITVLQALNYAQLGQDEDALVEVRRVNERLEKMIVDEKKPYEQLAIARYLGGILYEDQREWDSAYIDYAKALELSPGLGPLAEPLLRLAKKTGREGLYEELRARFPDLPHEPLSPDEGQVVVVVEAGLSPEKEPQNQHYRDSVELITVPVYRDRGYAPAAEVRIASAAQKAVTVTSLDQVAKVHLNDRVGRMLAKQFASALLKAGVAAGIGAATKSKELGYLTFLLLNVANQPDLRSWLSLPAEFQLARFRLPPGLHTVEVAFGGRLTTKQVEVKPGRVALVVMRRYR
ncbi:COG3014 family protein [Stigmatella aurantiaca]|uniref:Tetratricopeptide repeat domain protein n=1 Tax=Stigmatella aurantiaca (strain DW4/3-1) TaxID=378806 RepID=E3FIE5_STIAD|nr:hypothetical protein [Stigmatella aurantiaca]ADO74106.1 Tetratricopeptide repeat domain protein [Stigmatella aurantiaca DW4/3-1]